MCFSGMVYSVRRGVVGVEESCKCVTVPLGGLMVVENRNRELSSRKTGVGVTDISSLHHSRVPRPHCQGVVPRSSQRPGGAVAPIRGWGETVPLRAGGEYSSA